MASLFLRCLASNLCEGWSFSDAFCYAPPEYSGPCAPVAHWSQLAAEEKIDLEASVRGNANDENMRMFQGPSRFGAKVCFCEAPGRKSASLRGFLLERHGPLG